MKDGMPAFFPLMSSGISGTSFLGTALGTAEPGRCRFGTPFSWHMHMPC